MYCEKHKYTEEVWGAKLPVEEIEVLEEYNGEVYDKIMAMIEKDEIEYIPETITVYCESIDDYLDIFPEEYLNEKELLELELLIEKKYNYEGE